MNIFLIVLCAAASRVFSIFIYKYKFQSGLTGDAAVHFVIIQNVKKNFFFKKIPQYLISDEPSSYPRGFHNLCYFIPLGIIRSYPYLPNFLIFVLFCLILAIIVKGQGAVDFWLFWIIFLAVPSNHLYNSSSIAYLGLSERLLAKCTTSLYFLLLLIALQGNGFEEFVVYAVICGAIAMNSSIFARQAIFFISVLFSILTLSTLPLIALISCGLLSFLFSGNHFLRGLNYTYKHWVSYLTFTRKSEFHRNSLSSFLNFRDLTIENTLIGLGKKIVSKEPLNAIVRFPEILVFLLYLSIHKQAFDHADLLVLSTLIVYVLTSTSAMNFLGEGHRYIDYALCSVFPYYFATESESLGIIYLGLLFAMSGLSFLLFAGTEIIKKRKRNDDLDDFLSGLTIKEGSIVFPVPMRIGADLSARVNVKTFWWQPGNVSNQIYLRYIEEYPFLKRDWKIFTKDFNIEYILIDKASYSLISWRYDFSQAEKVHEDANYALYVFNSLEKG